MVNRGIRFAYVLIIVAATALAFVVLRNFDEVVGTGPSHVVLLSRSDGTAGATETTAVVESLARETGTNIGRLVADPRDPDTHRHVYLAVGDPGAESSRWLRTGYPNFSRHARTDMHPYAEAATLAPIGYYFVYGSAGTAHQLLDRLRVHGFDGRVDPLFTLGRGLEYFGHGALLWCFGVVALIVISVVASSVVFNAKGYGVQRLQGSGWLVIYARDLVRVAAFTGAALVVIATLTTLLLLWYNGLHQIATYWLIAGGFLAVFLVLAAATHLLALALLFRTGVLGAVKGEVSANGAMTLSYGIRLAAVLLTLFVGVSLAGDFHRLRDSRTSVEAWAAVDDAWTIQLGGYGQAEAPRIIDGIGRWIRGLDERGAVTLARVTPLTSGPEPGGRQVLLVNPAFLERNPILGPDGARVTPAAGDAGTVRVLVPHRDSGDAERIARLVAAEWRTPSVRVEAIRDQPVFSYTSWVGGHDVILDAPVLVVAGAASGVIPDGDYTAFASTGDLMFHDPDTATAGLTAAGFHPYVQGFRWKAQEAAEHRRVVAREFDMQVVNLLAAVAVLLATGLGVSIVYSRRHAQTLFVKFISGWRFTAVYRPILLAEGAIAVAVVLFGWWQATAAVTAATTFPAPPIAPGDLAALRLQPVIAAVVALAGFALVTGTLARTYRRVVKAHSASLA